MLCFSRHDCTLLFWAWLYHSLLYFILIWDWLNPSLLRCKKSLLFILTGGLYAKAPKTILNSQRSLGLGFAMIYVLLCSVLVLAVFCFVALCSPGHGCALRGSGLLCLAVLGFTALCSSGLGCAILCCTFLIWSWLRSMLCCVLCFWVWPLSALLCYALLDCALFSLLLGLVVLCSTFLCSTWSRSAVLC